MKTRRDSFFLKIKDPDWVRKKRLHYLMMPEWADSKCVFVITFTLVSLVGGILSCFLFHGDTASAVDSTGGLVVWFISFAALLINGYFYIKGMYQKFLDSAMDVYY